MKRYAKYVKAHQSLVQLCKQLVVLPSPRTRFFNYLLGLTHLSPNTLKMVLCTTSSGVNPGPKIRKLLSKHLMSPVHVLFPEHRQKSGSLVSIYSGLSNKSREYEDFVKDICMVTNSPRKTVITWIYGQRTPKIGDRRRIANLLGSSMSHLFPERELTDKTR